MADPISWLAAKAAQAVTAWAISATGSTSLVFAQTVYATVYAATYAAVALGGAALARSLANVPDPEAAKQVFNQPVPPRRRGWGKFRAGGPRACNEAVNEFWHQIIPLVSQPVGAYGQLWINDDQASLTPALNPATPSTGAQVVSLADGTWGDSNELIYVEARYGKASQTAYSQAVSALSNWASTARGDGIASIYFRARHGKQKNFQQDYPTGLPVPSIEVQPLAYDWRDVTQDRDDSTTWKVSRNPVVCLVNELWRYRGYDWDRRFAPVLSRLTAEANVCDEDVPLAAGGTQKRYECGGLYEVTNEPAGVYQRLLESMDGFMAETGAGTVLIYAGKYRPPTITFTDRNIIGYQVQRYMADEDRVNEVVAAFTDPATGYNKQQCNPWQDAASIARHGKQSREFYPVWVQSNGQARRLAKRLMSRINAEYRGSVTVDLYGLQALGQRYIKLQISDRPALNPIIVEIVSPPAIDLVNGTVTFDWVHADPDIDDWNAAIEEDPPGEPGDRIAASALTQPTIDAVDVQSVPSDFGGRAAQLLLTVTGPARVDLSWQVEWRLSGAAEWIPLPSSEEASGDIRTSNVPGDSSIEVRVSYLTGSGREGPWSAEESVSTSILILREDGTPLLREDDTEYRRE